jgi:ornithine cyclodeaminase/alanine dehydrogenase-like protein (mu-crystallin family)
MSNTGLPIGLVNAEEITAFRTALASSLLLMRRSHLKTITVFGAGKQAYWHIRLALLLRGHTIKTVNVINRTFSTRAKALLKTFLHIDHDIKSHEGWTNTKFGVMSPEYGEYDRLVKEQLRAADAVITTVPSATPLFDPLILTSTEGRRKGRLLIAIGSYKPHMIELPIECLHQAVRPARDHRHFHRHAAEGGVVVVDTLTGCLKEAGEIIQAGLNPMQLVEVGELVMLEEQPATEPPSPSSDIDLEKLSLGYGGPGSSMASVLRDGTSTGSTTPKLKHSRSGSFSRALSLSRHSSWSADKQSPKNRRSSSVDGRRAGNGSTRSTKDKEKEDSMGKWLRSGNVIYKSVGMGLMDLVVGGELVKLAREKGVGTTIYDF